MALTVSTAIDSTSADETSVSFHKEPGRLRIEVGDQPLVTYMYEDEEIPRPYFAHVCVPGGAQVTRNHPPREGVDRTDHATFHPGIWLAFGDISGADFWRNRARVKHVRFTEDPRGEVGRGTFAVENVYESDGKPVCHESCRYSIVVRPNGCLLIWDSSFHNDQREFAFGDQEEMGLGVRVATPITVDHGGKITNSDGLIDESETWGEQADWCGYSGCIDGEPVGIMLMADPGNFRRSWFHTRDYGLVVANPFGRNAFAAGEASRVVVKQGEKFRLRFAVFIHGSQAISTRDLEAEYRAFVECHMDR